MKWDSSVLGAEYARRYYDAYDIDNDQATTGSPTLHPGVLPIRASGSAQYDARAPGIEMAEKGLRKFRGMDAGVGLRTV